MKNVFKKYRIRSFLNVLLVGLSLGACEDYLDKAPEATLAETDIFRNFVSFQGFVEEMYHCITDPHKALAGNIYHSMLISEEVLSNAPCFGTMEIIGLNSTVF